MIYQISKNLLNEIDKAALVDLDNKLDAIRHAARPTNLDDTKNAIKTENGKPILSKNSKHFRILIVIL